MKGPFCIFLLLATCSLSIAAQTPENNCPKIAVVGPSGVTRAGESMTFSASISSGAPGKVEYNWTVSAGTIQNGQGTSSINVRSTPEMGETMITATVKVSGLLAGCSDSAYEEAGIIAIIDPESADSFGNLSKSDVKARIDNVYIRLQNDPDLRCIIIVGFNKNDSRNFKVRYLKNILDGIIALKKDPARVKFLITEGESELDTQIWLFYPEANIGSFGFDESKLIKGEELRQKMRTLFLTK
jgi:hypothetical protein